MIFHSPGAMLPFAILGGLAWLAIVAGVVLLAIWAIRAFPSTRFAQATPTAVESPLDTLARRFALGEITAEDFERSRDLLRGESSKP
jgi:Predicted membrane protein (DUF2078).